MENTIDPAGWYLDQATDFERHGCPRTAAAYLEVATAIEEGRPARGLSPARALELDHAEREANQRHFEAVVDHRLRHGPYA